MLAGISKHLTNSKNLANSKQVANVKGDKMLPKGAAASKMKPPNSNENLTSADRSQ